jgi:acyl carrier protein
MDDTGRHVALLERLYEEVKGVRRDLRPDDMLGDDLQMDSLAAAELLSALGDELGLELENDERVGDLRTVGDVLALISSPQPH